MILSEVMDIVKSHISLRDRQAKFSNSADGVIPFGELCEFASEYIRSVILNAFDELSEVGERELESKIDRSINRFYDNLLEYSNNPRDFEFLMQCGNKFLGESVVRELLIFNAKKVVASRFRDALYREFGIDTNYWRHKKDVYFWPS